MEEYAWALTTFKIDLIVWKSNIFGLLLQVGQFKIDLIVWKFFESLFHQFNKFSLK